MQVRVAVGIPLRVAYVYACMYVCVHAYIYISMDAHWRPPGATSTRDRTRPGRRYPKETPAELASERLGAQTYTRPSPRP